MYLLTKGDIILFKAPQDSWFSRAIALLSKSDVSHAAMVYSEDSIVEVLADGIQVNKVTALKGEEAYVLRLLDAPDSAPLIRSADAYLKAKTKYDFPGLFILAGLLIYRYITPAPNLLRIANHILDAACFELDKMIQRARHYESRAMVCSQLIYQIFYDCGDDYKINIPGTCLWKSQKDNASPCSVRLIEYLPKEPAVFADRSAYVSSPKDFLTKMSEEDLYRELCRALAEADACSSLKEAKDLPASLLSDTLPRTERFLSLLKRFLTLVSCDIPMDAMFVTPGDILNHSTNLKQITLLSLKRI